MVQATHGVLITGDVALIEYIRRLDQQQLPGDRFIINPSLGDTHLLVKDKKLEFVKEKVKDWQESLRFEPPKPLAQ